jgi:hypothetical protein
MYYAAGPSGDVDADGRLDLFLGSWFPRAPSLLLRNETTSGGFVDVAVRGGGGVDRDGGRVNRDGAGAVVRAYRAGGAGDPAALLASELIAASSGYCSASPPAAHLGLGEATRCDLVVTLPHGAGAVTRRDVEAGGPLTVEVGR